MGNQKINHIAVWILVVAHMVVAFLWYASFLFGSKWMELLNKTEQDFASSSPVKYVIAIIAALAMTYLLAWLFKELKVNTVLKGLLYSLVFCIGFLFLEMLTIGIFSLKPFGLTAIDGGMYLVNFLIAGAVLGGWKKHEVAASD